MIPCVKNESIKFKTFIRNTFFDDNLQAHNNFILCVLFIYAKNFNTNMKSNLNILFSKRKRK